MSNYVKKQNNNLSKSLNPFKEYFSNINESEDKNALAQTFQNINNDKFGKDILGNQQIGNETAFESKINQQFSGKSINKRNSLHFYSGKDVNKFRESFKDLGIFSSEEYLSLRKIKKLTQKEYDDLKNSIIDTNNLTKLYNILNNVNCNFKSYECNSSVGGITPLTYLIENSFNMDSKQIKEMNDKYNILNKYIYNYRAINGDGNCFYRAVMFRYFEILVLNENIEYLQNIIYDIVESFKSKELKERIIIRGINIKPDLTCKVLILIVDLLKNKMKEEAYQILVKSFSTSNKFDYGIILYFRYILYDYIRKNENKAYTKSFPIKLGNLLPSQFETIDGQFLFNDFYNNYLLKFFTDSEKIIIYLTPLVLDIELNIIIFDDCEEDILQKFKYEGNSELKTPDIISLLNRKNHYDIIYSLRDYDKNKNVFINYENNKKSVFLSNAENLMKKNNINESNFNILKDSFKDIKKDNEFNSKTAIYNKKSIINNNQINNNQNANKKINNKYNERNNPGSTNNNIKYNNNNIQVNNNYNQDNFANKIVDNNQINPKAYDYNNNNSNIINNIERNNNNSQISHNLNNTSINKERNNYNQINNDFGNINRNNEISKNYKINNDYGNVNNNERNNNGQINRNFENINKINERNKNYNINNNSLNININNNINNNKNSNNNVLKSTQQNFNENNNINLQNYYSNQANSGRPGQIVNQNDISRKSKYLFNNKDNNIDNNQSNQRNLNDNNQQQNSSYNSNIQKYNNDILNKETEGKKQKYNFSQNNAQINDLNKSNQNNFNNNNISLQKQNQNIGLKTPGNNSNQSNISSTSNIPNTSQIGLITPGQIINQNICMNCNKEKIDNLNINICKYCFKSKIVDDIYSSYLEICEQKKNPLILDGKIEIKIKKDENIKVFRLFQAIEEYNKYYKDEKLDKKTIINELKKKVCRFCEKDINIENMELYAIPCKCHFCCKEHIEYYFSQFDFYKGFKCFCGIIYSNDMFFDLGVLCNDLNIETKDKIHNLLTYYLNNTCCICGNLLQFSRYSNNVVISPDNSFKNIDKYLSQLLHFFCKQCYMRYIINNNIFEFKCQICQLIHYIINSNY